MTQDRVSYLQRKKRAEILLSKQKQDRREEILASLFVLTPVRKLILALAIPGGIGLMAWYWKIPFKGETWGNHTTLYYKFPLKDSAVWWVLFGISTVVFWWILAGPGSEEPKNLIDQADVKSD